MSLTRSLYQRSIRESEKRRRRHGTEMLPLPYALYDSNGNLFELHQGGQPRRVHEIGWQKLQPIQGPDPVNSDIVSPNSNR